MKAEEAREIREKRETREEKSPPHVTISLTHGSFGWQAKTLRTEWESIGGVRKQVCLLLFNYTLGVNRTKSCFLRIPARKGHTEPASGCFSGQFIPVCTSAYVSCETWPFRDKDSL